MFPRSWATHRPPSREPILEAKALPFTSSLHTPNARSAPHSFSGQQAAFHGMPYNPNHNAIRPSCSTQSTHSTCQTTRQRLTGDFNMPQQYLTVRSRHTPVPHSRWQCGLLEAALTGWVPPLKDLNVQARKPTHRNWKGGTNRPQHTHKSPCPAPLHARPQDVTRPSGRSHTTLVEPH